MNVVEISEAEAFKAGSDLWIIKNEPNAKWWQELDFRSGFLLSQCLYHSKKTSSPKLNEILELTELAKFHFSEDEDMLLVGTSDHFLNKWVLIWNQEPAKVSAKLEQISASLKTNSLRFFSHSELIMGHMEARPKTSLTDITFIENT